MADFVDTTVQVIDQRLNELEEEVARLEAARTALIGAWGGSGRSGGASRSAGSGGAAARGGRRSGQTGRGSGQSGRGSGRSGRAPGRPRGRRGGNTRANQALELVRSRPGITIPQIAEQMKIEPNYLYRVLPRLVEDGQVRREGQGWVPASS